MVYWLHYTPMPTLKAFRDCRIAMYPRDHAPPHVHVEFRDGDRCTVDIRTLKVRGSVRPRSRLAGPLAWIASRTDRLLARWLELVR